MLPPTKLNQHRRSDILGKDKELIENPPARREQTGAVAVPEPRTAADVLDQPSAAEVPHSPGNGRRARGSRRASVEIRPGGKGTELRADEAFQPTTHAESER